MCRNHETNLAANEPKLLMMSYTPWSANDNTLSMVMTNRSPSS